MCHCFILGLYDRFSLVITSFNNHLTTQRLLRCKYIKLDIIVKIILE